MYLRVRALRPSVHLGAREPHGPCSFLILSHRSPRLFHVSNSVHWKTGSGDCTLIRPAARNAEQSARLLRPQPLETPPPGLDVERCRTQLPSDGWHFRFSVFSLDFGLIQPKQRLGILFFSKAYEVGTQPRTRRVCGSRERNSHWRGSPVSPNREPGAVRVGKSFRCSQRWDTLPRGLASHLTQTSGSRSSDWWNEADNQLASTTAGLDWLRHTVAFL